MAEALGVASSVIAVVDLSAKVIGWCVRYAQDVSHAKEDKKRLAEEVTRLNLASVNARNLLDGPHGSKLRASRALYLATVNSQSQLRRIERQLAERSGQGKVSFEALKWPFKHKDVGSVIQDIYQCTKAIYSALEVDQTLILLDIDHKIALDTLPIAEGASFDSYAEEHNPTCLPNTREGLLREIDSWISDPKSKTIFWLNGMAGTGKSTISRTVARSRSERGDLGASFFFKRGETDRGNLTKFVTTVARRLAWSMPGVASFIKSVVDTDPSIVDKSVREQFEKLIQGPLSKAAATSLPRPSVVIIVDALDECESDAGIKLLLELFSTLRFVGPLHVRVLITSRPELPVRFGFSSIGDTHQDLILHKIPQPIIEHDISVFLRHELTNIRNHFNEQAVEELKLPVDWPGEANLERLTMAVVPLFIFAATLCRFVNDSCLGSPDELLQSVLHHTGNNQASKLDMTYSPVLKQQLVNRSGRESCDIIESFRLIVGTIVTLASPLSMRALALLLDVHVNKVTTRLRVLYSVLEIPDSLDSPVRLLHLSFRDYLVDPENREMIDFWVDEEAAHRRLAKNCLRVMRNGLRKNMCSLSFPGMHRSAVDVRLLAERIPPELQYACMNWVYHQTKIDLGPNDVDDMYNFLETHFLHWLEVLSLIGRLAESIGLIDELQSIVDAEKVGQVPSFLHDAKRFVLNYRWVVDTAPLQLYAASIVFTPKQSIVRQTFKRYLPEWISLLPHVDSDWNAVLQTLEGHTGSVRIWSVATGKEEQTLKGHTGPIFSVVFSNDSKLIASGSYDNTIKIWNATTGKEEKSLEGHTKQVSSVVFSNDSMLIASGSYDNTIKIWNVTTGKEEKTLEGHTEQVTSVVFSNNSTLIASGSYDSTIKIWNATTGKEEKTLEGHTERVTSVAFSNDSTLIASGSYDNSIMIWNVTTGNKEKTLEGYTEWVTSVAFSNDSRLIASGSHDNTIKIWNVATGKEEQTLKGHTGAVFSVAFSDDGKLIASASGDNTIKIWNIAMGKEEQTIEGHTERVGPVVFSNDGRLVASGSFDNTIKIWNVATGKEEQTLKGHTGAVFSVAFSDDGKLIASASGDNTIKIWNIAMGKEERTLKGHKKVIVPMVFSNDGRRIASGSHDNTIKIWNITTGKEEWTLEGHNDWVNSVVFSNDGRLIASGSSDNTIKIWNAATGKEEQTLKGHKNWLTSVVFSNDGMRIASGSCDWSIKIWNITMGKEEQTFEGHTERVTYVLFSNDDRLIASGSCDGTIKIWNVATGINVQSFNASVTTDILSFIDHDSILVTSSGRFSLRSWEVSATQPSKRETGLDSPEVREEVDGRLGFGINHDMTWITAGGPDGRKFLWLPPDFRPNVSATSIEPSESVIAIGCLSGRVIIMSFRRPSFLDEV
ncbi:hypothetical protein LZL87_003104 [Fusarium oxysporum]|nr:hypothetical protein LZL87_003104 [Fusarium oxysporum]